ncbi:MAG: hypothetical protein HQ581_29425 [Planctomycetes bacterium]|nr:hypothetical protein [Planctomycetota bacterium]
MPPRTVTIALVALLIAGCGEDPQPSRRIIAGPPGSENPHGGSPNPHGGMSKTQGGMANPHGGMAMPRGGRPGQMSRPAATGPEVHLGSMVMTAPDGWQRQQVPERGFILADFSLPAAEGDIAGGRLTISGVKASAPVDAMMDYWRQQFTGTPTETPQETREISGVSVVLVGMSGAFGGQPQGANTATGNTGDRMQVATFILDGRRYGIKCVGPTKTMANSEGAFMAFIESLRRPEPPSTKAGPAKPEPPAAPEDPKPETAEPEATQPETAEPEATQSEATEPESPQPEVLGPEATEPETSDEETPDPEASEAP